MAAKLEKVVINENGEGVEGGKGGEGVEGGKGGEVLNVSDQG